MKLHILVLSVLVFSFSCSSDTERLKTEQIKSQHERDEKFSRFQIYTNTAYPNWKIKGYKSNLSYVLSDSDSDYYTVLLTDGENDKEIILKESEFTATDGTKFKRFSEPTKEELDVLFKKEEKLQKE